MKVTLGSMSSVTIDGRTFSGRNVSIVGDKVIVDGVTQEGTLAGPISVIVNGDAADVSNVSGPIEVNGNVRRIDTVSGSVKVSGTVGGSIETVSGSVTCGKVQGSVETLSGKITHTRS